jgi:hypothetical protein
MFNQKQVTEEEKIEALRNQYLKIQPPPIPFFLFRLLPDSITAPYMMKMMNYVMTHLD